jgi:hypothetical protein
MSAEKKLNEEKAAGLTRRDFLKGAAAGAVGITLAGAISACENPTETIVVNDPLDADYVDKKWSFEVPPAKIANSAIAETKTAEVIVIGSGMSGLCAAVSAAEEGLSVIVVSAGRGAVSRGGSNHAIGSTYQNRMIKKWNDMHAGDPNYRQYEYPYDAQASRPYIQTEQLSGIYAMDKIKWSRWVRYSGKSMDWMIKKMYDSNQQLVVNLETPYPDVDGHLGPPPSTHNFFNKDTTMGAGVFFGAPQCASAYAQLLTSPPAGSTITPGQIFYEHKALQLVRGTDNKSGKVDAVICERLEDGKKIKFTGTKALILATGDFSRDRDMMAKYAPWAYEHFKDILKFEEGPAYDKGLDFAGMDGLMDGHGQKMGLWVGAAWQKVFPNAAMINIATSGPTHATIDNFWGCNLNLNGKRYQNENTNFGFGAYSKLNQPGGISYGVWDATYAETEEEWDQALGCSFMNDNKNGLVHAGGGQIPGGITDPSMMPQSTKDIAAIKAGWLASTQDGNGPFGPQPAQYATGTTVEELVDDAINRMGWKINRANAIQSIKNYDYWCKIKEDQEFQVNPKLLHELLKADNKTARERLYMARSGASTLLCVAGGLRTDEYLRVCDKDDAPIEGLYNVGTMTGDFFAGAYNFGLSGQNLGATCLTLPWILGKELAGKTLADLDTMAIPLTPQVEAV